MQNITAGTQQTLSQAFVNLAGTPTNPTAVVCRIQTPDGVITDYSGALTTPTTGTYQLLFTPVQFGVHRYEFIGTGTVVFANQGYFNVTAVAF